LTGFAAYLTKPSLPDDLIAAILQVCRGLDRSGDS